MRSRTAGAVWAAALALGGLTGAYVLPAGGLPGSLPSTPSTPSVTGPTTQTGAPTTTPAPAPPRSEPPSTTPTATPSPAPSPPRRITEDDLLSVRSFADQSVSVSYESRHGETDRTQDATSCVDDDVHKTGTLKKTTGYDPALAGIWVQTDIGDETRQLVATADDPAAAEKSVARLVAALAVCQEAEPGHYVLGAATTENFSSTRSATWVGFYPDEQNTTGRAPDGVEPCGGTLLARNGSRFTAVTVSMCLDGSQLAGLAAAASKRLG